MFTEISATQGEVQVNLTKDTGGSRLLVLLPPERYSFSLFGGFSSEYSLC